MERLSLYDISSIALCSDKMWDGIGLYLSTYVRVTVDRVVSHGGLVQMDGCIYIPQYDTERTPGVRIPVEVQEMAFTINTDDLLAITDEQDKEEMMTRLSRPLPERHRKEYGELYPEVLAYYRDTVKYIWMRHIMASMGAMREQAINALHEYHCAVHGKQDNTIQSHSTQEGFGL